MSDTKHAEQNAKAWLESIAEMVAKLDNEETSEQAQQEIAESPLSVQVREPWHDPGDEEAQPEEFCILLSTGGPALRIVGDLTNHGDPESPKLQYQDWGTSWTEYPTSEQEQESLDRFVQQFYFGS